MQKTRYYVSRKNVLTWICALLLLGAVFVRIAAVTFWKGEEVSGRIMWFAVILPTIALVMFALQILTNANQKFYKTAIPVWILCICDGIVFSGTGEAIGYQLLNWLLFVAIAVTYTAITAGKTARDWGLLLIFGGPLLYLCMAVFLEPDLLQTSQNRIYFIYAEMLELLAGFLLVFAIKVHSDGKHHPTWGDRPDGRKLRSLDPISVIGVYIMPDRNESSNCITDSIEISEVERYVRRKRAQGLDGFGINDVFLAAYVRCVAKYPGVNRFISGQKIFSRDEDIQFCMTIKKEMSTTGSESIMKLHLSPYDTADDVYRKFHAGVEEIKNSPLDSDFDNVARYLTFIPGVLLKFTVWLLKTLDYFGLLPGFLLEVSPFHSSVFFTSMGSLGIPPIVHHLYDFGNMPVFCAFGAKRRVKELQPDGTVVVKKYIDYSFNLDERTVDGFYYASVLKYFRRLLKHPDVLDERPEEVLRDVD